jgi:hypothetical protein
MLRLVAVLLLGLALLHSVKPADQPFFEQRVWPVLRDSCLKCHGGDRTRNGLDISTREDLLRGGEHGPAVVPGEPEKSLLIRAIRYEGDYHMPPRSKLGPQQVADLVEWVKRGAPWGLTK